MLRKELLAPEIERINARFEKMISSKNDALRREIKGDIDKIDYSIKERMMMVEEVLT